jgi:RimJ/RimL family protein N-acetyltransferase
MIELKFSTERLTLEALTPDAIDAILAADGPGAPPLMEETLPFVRARLRTAPDEIGWWTWLVAEGDTGKAVGAVGFGGPPDAKGVVVMGYATYPARESRGYATEAARALLEWALQQRKVKRVCSTIPPSNARAINVAQKIGMRQVGTIWEEELDEVLLFAVERGEAGSR